METDFKEAMRQWRSGLCLVTAQPAHGDPIGLICNSFASVSLEPPLILWCLDHNSSAINQWRTVASYALHFLPEVPTIRDHPLVKRFTQRGGNKFRGASYDSNEHGDPIFAELDTRFDCTLFELLAIGDHDVMVGQPTNIIHPQQKRASCNATFSMALASN